jgi:hypothetical protein
MKELGTVNKPNLLQNTDNESVVGEEKQDRVIQNLCGKRSPITVMSCTDAVGKLIPPMAIFRREGYHSAFAYCFRNGWLFTIPDSGCIKEEKKALTIWLR